jgi:hypothetical protein
MSKNHYFLKLEFQISYFFKLESLNTDIGSKEYKIGGLQFFQILVLAIKIQNFDNLPKC